MRKFKNNVILGIVIAFALLFTACGSDAEAQKENTAIETEQAEAERGETEQAQAQAKALAEDISIDDIPEYSGSPYVEIDNNVPDFSEKELTTKAFEEYSDLDALERCGVTEACIGTEIMPTEERGKIGMIKPSGWQTVKYNDLVDGNYLYNRCHLIGFQLAGENANEKNLITGTRYMNVDGMLPFENEVAEYVKETDNHVMYRVTPIFEGDNLVASGVQMEAMSVEDDGEGVCFNVYCYNAQPGIEIDYATGESRVAEDTAGLGENTAVSESDSDSGSDEETYIINKNTYKFHKPDCSSIEDIKPQNKKEYTGDRDELIKQGYDPCGRCKP